MYLKRRSEAKIYLFYKKGFYLFLSKIVGESFLNNLINNLQGQEQGQKSISNLISETLCASLINIIKIKKNSANLCVKQIQV